MTINVDIHTLVCIDAYLHTYNDFKSGTVP